MLAVQCYIQFEMNIKRQMEYNVRKYEVVHFGQKICRKMQHKIIWGSVCMKHRKLALWYRQYEKDNARLTIISSGLEYKTREAILRLHK